MSVPAGRTFTYVYRPRDPGTYMYHCHVEDVEHVHMGMTGLVFVRPLMGDDYLYNDPAGTPADPVDRGSTASSRCSAPRCGPRRTGRTPTSSCPEWSDYRADFALLNGRVYPDTLAPNGSIDPFHQVVAPTAT